MIPEAIAISFSDLRGRLDQEEPGALPFASDPVKGHDRRLIHRQTALSRLYEQIVCLFLFRSIRDDF
jgi:hypothetical protein